MPVGLEVTNESGIPQIINLRSFQMFAITKGTYQVLENNNPSGMSGTISLPNQALPYLVFIRCSQTGASAFASNTGFVWRMAQGTTSFDWWAWGQVPVPGNSGMQVFNADGTIQWDMSNRPLKMLPIDKGSAAGPSFTELSPENTWNGPHLNSPKDNLAYLLSDLGRCHDIYAYSGSGSTIRANMRYQPMISTPTSNGVNINYARVRENRRNSLSGASYQSFSSTLPQYILAAEIY